MSSVAGSAHCCFKYVATLSGIIHTLDVDNLSTTDGAVWRGTLPDTLPAAAAADSVAAVQECHAPPAQEANNAELAVLLRVILQSVERAGGPPIAAPPRPTVAVTKVLPPLKLLLPLAPVPAKWDLHGQSTAHLYTAYARTPTAAVLTATPRKKSTLDSDTIAASSCSLVISVLCSDVNSTNVKECRRNMNMQVSGDCTADKVRHVQSHRNTGKCFACRMDGSPLPLLNRSTAAACEPLTGRRWPKKMCKNVAPEEGSAWWRWLYTRASGSGWWAPSRSTARKQRGAALSASTNGT
eukprot:SM000139S00112  [mRNA]  locus=s139:102928:104414:- [translate_table: standard]